MKNSEAINQCAFEISFLSNDSLFNSLFLSHHCHNCQKSISFFSIQQFSTWDSMACIICLRFIHSSDYILEYLI